MIAAVYFNIQTSRDLIDLSKESIQYEKIFNKSLRSNQIKVRLGNQIFGYLVVHCSTEIKNLFQIGYLLVF